MVTVLVVDDVPSEVNLLSDYLRQGGYTVVGVTSAQEALAKIAENKPDAVVADLVMPGMNGLEFCRDLKKNSETRDLPFIACTSKNQELDRFWGMKQGVDVYLVKPCSREELLRAVRSVVQ